MEENSKIINLFMRIAEQHSDMLLLENIQTCLESIDIRIDKIYRFFTVEGDEHLAMYFESDSILYWILFNNCKETKFYYSNYEKAMHDIEFYKKSKGKIKI